MDIPTSNASFLAGEGDAACVSGDVSFQPDKENFVVASTGPMAKLGLQTNFVANSKALQDEELREAMKVFLRCSLRPPTGSLPTLTRLPSI